MIGWKKTFLTARTICYCDKCWKDWTYFFSGNEKLQIALFNVSHVFIPYSIIDWRRHEMVTVKQEWTTCCNRCVRPKKHFLTSRPNQDQQVSSPNQDQILGPSVKTTKWIQICRERWKILERYSCTWCLVWRMRGVLCVLQFWKRPTY